MAESPPSTFEEWKTRNPKLLTFLSMQVNSRGPSFANVFRSKRKGMHSRTVDSLSHFSVQVSEEIRSTSEKIEKINSDPIPEILPLKFDCAKNMECRILYFTAIEGHERYLRHYQSRLRHLEMKKEQIAALIQLFVRNLIPESFVVVILDQFFVLQLRMDHHVLVEVDRLLAFSRFLESRILGFAEPAAIVNFPEFFLRLVREAAEVYDDEICSFQLIEGEVELARFVFQSPLGEKIDGFIQRSVADGWVQFSAGVPLFCRSLLKDFQFQNETHEFVAVILLFRIIIERIYEKVATFHATSLNGETLVRAWDCPIAHVKLPEQLVPECDISHSSRAVFSAIPKFAGPADELATLHFLINPMDILIGFRRMMVKVHANALREHLGREPTEKDLQMILGFDELFTLLFGSFIASDVVDIAPMTIIVKLLTPRNELSPVLEYSLVCFEAVMLEIETLSAKQLTE
jgi:hypothetical protein